MIMGEKMTSFKPFPSSVTLILMKTQILETTTLIPAPIEKVFEFFSKAENLNELTPPELSFKILTPSPIPMAQGTHIDYKISIQGIPMRWKTLISVWNPPFQFRDEQLSGPYCVWIHTHTFVSKGNMTEMTDRVEYLSKGWLMAPFLHMLFVDRKVREIFTYRENKLKELFPTR